MSSVPPADKNLTPKAVLARLVALRGSKPDHRVDLDCRIIATAPLNAEYMIQTITSYLGFFYDDEGPGARAWTITLEDSAVVLTVKAGLLGPMEVLFDWLRIFESNCLAPGGLISP
jgi:hypothetical protein